MGNLDDALGALLSVCDMQIELFRSPSPKWWRRLPRRRREPIRRFKAGARSDMWVLWYCTEQPDGAALCGRLFDGAEWQ